MATTLEILAPYLPFGIEVKGLNGIGTLDELERPDKYTFYPWGRAGIYLANKGETHWDNIDDCVPVLRSFSQLVEPLEDGTIPAVEVAKLALSDKEACFKVESDSFYMIGNHRMRRSGIVAKAEYDDIGTTRVIIAERWRVSIEASDGIVGPPDCALAIYDYLRSKHFALPVNGRPLVANVDFIPLTAPSTPTREADNNPTTTL